MIRFAILLIIIFALVYAVCCCLLPPLLKRNASDNVCPQLSLELFRPSRERVCVIVDRTAYILGGRNTQDAYLSGSAADAFQDRDIPVYEEHSGGPSSLTQLRTYFETIWNLSDCIPRISHLSCRKRDIHQASLTERWMGLHAQYGAQLTEIDWLSETMRANSVTLLTGFPDACSKPPALWEQLCQITGDAYREVMIQTPFVMCDSAIYGDLARLCSQTDTVQVLTNAVENSVNPLGIDYANQRGDLLATGVQLYEYTGDKPMHTKTILVDHAFTIIGSFNLDNRSVYLDTEVMLLIDCPELHQMLRTQMKALQTKSRLITAGGTVLYGADTTLPALTHKMQWKYSLLRVLLHPFSYLL